MTHLFLLKEILEFIIPKKVIQEILLVSPCLPAGEGRKVCATATAHATAARAKLPGQFQGFRSQDNSMCLSAFPSWGSYHHWGNLTLAEAAMKYQGSAWCPARLLTRPRHFHLGCASNHARHQLPPSASQLGKLKRAQGAFAWVI